MKYGAIKYLTIENGIGCRTSLFVSGCRHACPGCFQPESHDFDYGEEFDDKALNLILDSLKPSYVAGLTILGGEPFEPENQECVLNICQSVKKAYSDKTIWIYSGCTFEDLMFDKTPYNELYTSAILSTCDILVDGPFVLNLKNLMLPFRGSSNQRVLDLKRSMESRSPVLSEYHDSRNTIPERN